VLTKGKLVQVDVGGQLWELNVGMPLLGVGLDADGPVAFILVARTSGEAGTECPIHLGETVALNDWASVTLVSFDNKEDGVQAVTFLFTG